MNSMPSLATKTDEFAIKLYDMSIADIKERNKQALYFKKGVQAANFLGYPPNKFYERVGEGKYAYHQTSGKQYAARRVSVNKVA